MLQQEDQSIGRPRLPVNFAHRPQVSSPQQNVIIRRVSVGQTPNIGFVAPSTSADLHPHQQCPSFASPRQQSSPLQQQQQQFFRTSLVPSLPVSSNNSDDPIIIESSGSSSTSSNGSSCGPPSAVPPNVYFHRTGPSTSSNVLFQPTHQQQYRLQQQYNAPQPAQHVVQLQPQQQQQRHPALLAMQQQQQQSKFLATGQVGPRPVVLTQQVLNDQTSGGASLFAAGPRNVAGNNVRSFVRLQSLTQKQLSTLLPTATNIITQGQLIQQQQSPNNFTCANRNPSASQECSPVLLHQQMTPAQRQQTDKVLKDEYYKRKHYLLKKCVKSLAFKNAALCDEVARLNQRIKVVTEERKLLLQRLITHERAKEKRRSSSTVSRKVPKTAALSRQASAPMPNLAKELLVNGSSVKMAKVEPKFCSDSCSQTSVELNVDENSDVVRNIVNSVVTSGHESIKSDVFG